MKKLLFIISILFIYGCNTNPNYERNLATAKKLFELHGEEDLDGQIALISDKIQSNSSMYGSETAGYDQYVNMLKGYHAAFDDIKYTADIWLPGTDSLGNLDGSVRTYGTWTGVNVATGKVLDLHGYWYMNFDEDGKVIAQGDYFDFGGMINAVYPKNLVFIQVAVKKGKKDEMIKLLKSERGIPTTVAYDGAIRYEMAYNDETNTCEPACQMRLFGLCVNPMEKPKIPSIGTMISNTTTSAVGGVSSVLNMGKNAVLGGVSKIPIPKVKF